MRRTRLAICLLAGFSATAAAAQDDPFTPAQREALDDRIRSYLLANPELFLEVFDLLEQRRMAQQADADATLVAENADRLFNSTTSPVIGNPQGDVTVVKFSDYRCGFCKSAGAFVAELVETDPNVRVVIKEFPILGEESVLAGRVALAASQQGSAAYDRLHSALLGFNGELDEMATLRVAEDAGIDMTTLRSDMEDPGIADEIRANYALARALRIEGTPSFIIGDQIVRGMMPLERMRELVAQSRADRG